MRSQRVVPAKPFSAKRFAAMLLAALSMPLSHAAAAAEVRFHPSSEPWAQQTEAQRGLGNVVLHNAAVVNRGESALRVAGVRFDLLQGEDLLQSQFVSPAQLDAIARGGAALAGSGMMEVVDFQFAPAVLFGPGATVSDDGVLQPGEALYLPTRFFTFAGRPDRLRTTVTFEGDAAPAIGELPIRYGSAPGRLRFPATGRWYVGAASTPHSHHRWAVPQEFALDLIRVGAGGGTHDGDGQQVEDYHAYGEPVLAAAAGEVLAIRDSMPDSVALLRRPGETIEAQMARVVEFQNETMQQGGDGIVGNFVLLGHADGVHTLYAHLAPGSVAVAVGDRVAAGERLGAVGSSGSSTEPHLHFHACDGPEVLRCAGLPVSFDNVELPLADHPRQIQSGDLVDALPP